MAAFALGIWIALGVVLVHDAWAAGFTTFDTLAAVDQASVDYHIDYWYLRSIVECETRGAPTFNPYARGSLGERGAVQVLPYAGEWQRWSTVYGYDIADLDNPYVAVPFLAQELLAGRARAWSCA